MSFAEEQREARKNLFILAGITLTVLVLITLMLMWAVPQYNVWRLTLQGEAELKKAEQTKQIMIETAKAERASAVERAEAVRIMGKMAKEYPEYRQQEFMQAFGEALREGNISQVIYVPTEANLPVLEAGRATPSPRP